MPWCPKCGAEYREDLKTCNDCNCELVEELEHLEDIASPSYDKEAFLISVGDNFEADMVEALLKANDIPVLKKYREAGDYLKIYMGGTNFGVDIYVPSQLLSMAQDVIKNSNALSDGEELQEEDCETKIEELEDVQRNDVVTLQQMYDKKSESTEKQDTARAEDAYSRTRRIRTWIILLLFVPGILWIIGALIYELYKWMSGI